MSAPARRHPAFDGFSTSACGGVWGGLAGVEVLMRPSGALWIPDAAALVVADLHLEKGSAYAARGQLLPPYDTGETLRRLAGEIEALRPRTVVLLGDTLHDPRAEARIGCADVEQLALMAEGRTLVWVVGNHDADGPCRLPGQAAAAVRICGLTLRHEPQAGCQLGEAAGHLHPCARVVGRGRSVRRRCFMTDGGRMILPAFGAYAGGLNVRDSAFAGLFSARPVAVALGAQRAHAIDWETLAGD